MYLPTLTSVGLQALSDCEFVEIFKTEGDDPDKADLWWLHVQRVEVHSVDSLFTRNEQLTDFAIVRDPANSFRAKRHRPTG
jgi:hypothetical protein